MRLWAISVEAIYSADFFVVAVTNSPKSWRVAGGVFISIHLSCMVTNGDENGKH